MLPSVPMRSMAEWTAIIRADLGRAIEGIISAGSHLSQAKTQLGKGRYGDMLAAINLHPETAKRLVRIAENPTLRDPRFADRLPTSMRTLAELARIDWVKLEGFIKDGVVYVGMERSEAEALLRAKPKPRKTIPQLLAECAAELEAICVDCDSGAALVAGASPEVIASQLDEIEALLPLIRQRAELRGEVQS